MSKPRKSPKPKLTVVGSEPNSPTQTLEQRIDNQRLRIFQAMGTIELACKVLDQDGEVGDDQEAQPLWWALSGAKELLNDVAAQLEPGVLRGEVSHG